MMEMVMKSKSAKTEYKVRDLVGKTIGRVQYFLNKTFVELLDEGRVTCVTGEPTASVNPQQKQKWVKNRRTGGGAIIPCTWLLWVPRGMEERVMEVIRARLPDVDGHEYMDVQVR
ncbi:unnamed protein product, partial [Porites evermanni]